MANPPPRLLRATVATIAHCLGDKGPDIATLSLKTGDLPLRLYLPPGGEAHPPLLFFHGGGFISCGLDTHDAICRRLAVASGLRIVAVGYRLAPEHPAPAQLQDALQACRWALSGPEALGSETRRIMVGGDSAGGYLAARCCAELNTESQQITGLLLLYPLLQMDADLWRSPAWRPVRWMGQVAAALVRRHLGGSGYPPLTADDLAHMPRTLLVSGGMPDPVHADAASFALRLRALGVSIEHFDSPPLLHGQFNLTRVSRRAREVLQRTGEALRSWMS